MSPRFKPASLSSGDVDEANMEVLLPDEEELHELDFHEPFEDGEEPSDEDSLDFDDYSNDDWE